MKVDIPVSYIAAVLAAGWGAVTDLRSHKIYNHLTQPAILAGIILNMLIGGIGGLADSFLGFLLGGVCMAFWMLGMLKAGDVKLYMAVGALGGWQFCGYTIIFSILIGGIAGAGIMILRKSGRRALKRLWLYFLQLVYTRQFYAYRPEERNAYFSFGCCIFGGSLFSLYVLLCRE